LQHFRSSEFFKLLYAFAIDKRTQHGRSGLTDHTATRNEANFRDDLLVDFQVKYDFIAAGGDSGVAGVCGGENWATVIWGVEVLEDWVLIHLTLSKFDCTMELLSFVSDFLGMQNHCCVEQSFAVPAFAVNSGMQIVQNPVENEQVHGLSHSHVTDRYVKVA